MADSRREVLVAVLAHPDDESFGMGGTLAYYASLGHRVYLICATLGEAGTVSDGVKLTANSLAEHRGAELDCAARVLGLAGVSLLGYRDSGMEGAPDNSHHAALINQPLAVVAKRIAVLLKELDAAVVLTFDPYGGYGHPDHIHIQRATALAVGEMRAEQRRDGNAYAPRAMYYQVMSRMLMRWVVRVMPVFGADPRHWGKNRDIDLVAIAEQTFPVHARIDIGSVAERKRLAGACHGSQGGGQMGGGLAGLVVRIFGGREEFMQAEPAIAEGKARIRTDLFAI